MRRPLSGEGLMSTALGDLKVFSGSAHPQLAREIAEFLGIPLGQARLRRFPDSEVSFQIDENIRGTDVFIVQPTSNPVDQHLMELLVMVDAFRRSSAARITVVVPYYGYARQDRKDKPRVPISAKLVANLISAAGVRRHDGQVLKIEARQMIEDHRRGEEMVHRNVKEPLDLRLVQVHAQHAIRSRRAQHVGHELRGDRHARLVFAILPPVSVVRNDRRDPRRR